MAVAVVLTKRLQLFLLLGLFLTLQTEARPTASIHTCEDDLQEGLVTSCPSDKSDVRRIIGIIFAVCLAATVPFCWWNIRNQNRLDRASGLQERIGNEEASARTTEQELREKMGQKGSQSTAYPIPDRYQGTSVAPEPTIAIPPPAYSPRDAAIASMFSPILKV